MDIPLPNAPPISPQYAEALFSDSATKTDILLNPLTRDGQDEQQDIYRGDPPPLPSPSPRSPSLLSSSPSSGSSGLGLRRGTLGAVLELAINRWARSTASNSSSSFVHTHAPRRRLRCSSNANTQNVLTEHLIRDRRKAREEFRTLPREFLLFLPAALAPQAPQPQTGHTKPLPDNPLSSQNVQQWVLCTSSLPLVLARLDSTVKQSAKTHRPKPHGTGLEPLFNDYMQLEPPSLPPGGGPPRSRKGKAQQGSRMPRNQERAGVQQSQRQPAWWLDVSSPTWSDMREIGKLLHLHPLTLEDILHQDPREKLEHFPRLGYYFVVFRALESERTRSRVRTQVGPCARDGASMSDADNGEIGATNVYIIVFRDGICSFHFEDISDHSERVRNKILQLEATVHVSSDWIAHGILDSIVDAYFPLLDAIEQEVKDLDDLVLSMDGQAAKECTSAEDGVLLASTLVSRNKTKIAETFEFKEKTQTESLGYNDRPILGMAVGRSAFSRLLTSIRRIVTVLPVWELKQWFIPSRQPQQILSSHSPLRRMAASRWLVTSLVRLLGTKSEVVSQIRKRLTGRAMMGPNVGQFEQSLAAEVSIYLGDIQDHILTLQQSLAHYERMLNHSHPTYVSHLRVSISQTQSGMDKALVMLSAFSVSIITMQLLTGVFSLNVHLPRNRKGAIPPNPVPPFYAFAAVMVGVVLAGGGVLLLARYWWLHAKRKYARRSDF